MKKILKKLISVPNKFEAFLQRRKLPTLVAFLIVSLLLAVSLPLWWYGVFDDIADETYRSGFNDVMEIEFYASDYAEEHSCSIEKSYRKTASKVSTEWLIRWEIDLYGYEEDEREVFPYARPIVKELARRRNAGRVLAKVYLDYPLFREDSGILMPNMRRCQNLEFLLSQPKLNRSLPFGTTPEELRDQKQQQKFDAVGTKEWEIYLESPYSSTPRAAETEYLRDAMRNCLYPDYWKAGYWDDEKLYEYASEYIDLDARDMRAALGLSE